MLIPNMPGTKKSHKWFLIKNGKSKMAAIEYIYSKNKASDNQNWSEL